MHTRICVSFARMVMKLTLSGPRRCLDGLDETAGLRRKWSGSEGADTSRLAHSDCKVWGCANERHGCQCDGTPNSVVKREARFNLVIQGVLLLGDATSSCALG